jgi:Swt1-like HEPN
MMEHAIKYFGLNNVALESDLRRVAHEKRIQLRPSRSKTNRDAYYPQITERIRHDAAVMAQHFELFYCLENSIRDLIRVRLEEKDPKTWWDQLVPQAVRDNAEKNRIREIQTGVTPRSDDLLSYINFGELGEIIKANWTLFSDTFSDLKAVETTLARLNTLRAPIAHCSMLAEDEVLRLRLSLRDWFRRRRVVASAEER